MACAITTTPVRFGKAGFSETFVGARGCLRELSNKTEIFRQVRDILREFSSEAGIFSRHGRGVVAQEMWCAFVTRGQRSARHLLMDGLHASPDNVSSLGPWGNLRDARVLLGNAFVFSSCNVTYV